jgi:hypothetical protein
MSLHKSRRVFWLLVAALAFVLFLATSILFKSKNLYAEGGPCSNNRIGIPIVYRETIIDCRLYVNEEFQNPDRLVFHYGPWVLDYCIHLIISWLLISMIYRIINHKDSASG